MRYESWKENASTCGCSYNPRNDPLLHSLHTRASAIPQLNSSYTSSVPPCQPLPPGEIIPSPVACSFPHWRWFTRAVVAAVQSIFNILFNGCQRGCVPGRKCCSSAIVRIPFPLPLGTGDAAISDEFSGKFQRGGGAIFNPNIAKGTTDPRVEFCLPKGQVLT